MTELVVTIGVPVWTIPAALLAGLYAPKLARFIIRRAHR